MTRARKVIVLSLLSLLPFVSKVSAKSNLSESEDNLFLLVTILSILVLVLVVSIFVIFIMRYREGNEETDRTPLSHATSTRLEMAWTGVAILIVLLLMAFSYPVLIGTTDASQTEGEGIPITVMATSGWQWVFFTPDGTITDTSSTQDYRPDDWDGRWIELPLTVGEKYTFTMYTPGDKMHSFGVGELNIKMDIIPGINNTLTVTIVEAGVYDIFCMEFCGVGHSNMRGVVVATGA